jgi:hypothetical protein
LILSSFGFVAGLAGVGFYAFRRVLGQWAGKRRATILNPSRWLRTALWLVLVPPILSIVWIHPLELGYYNSLIGGVSGAYQMGMETTYWCDALGRDMLDAINREAHGRPAYRLKPLGMDEDVLLFYQWSGRLSKDIIIGGENPRQVDAHLLQCRRAFMWDPTGRKPVFPDRYLYDQYLSEERKAIEAVTCERVPFYLLFGRLRDVMGE